MKKITGAASALLMTVIVLAGCETAKPFGEAAVAAEDETKEVVLINISYPNYNSLDELAKQADLIIEGKILKSSFQFLDIAEEPAKPKDENASFPYTIHDVQVEKKYKGETAEKEIIQVKQPGGEDQDQTFIAADHEKLEKNGVYVMFLETYDHSPASLLNPVQGLYRVEDNGAIFGFENNTIKLAPKDLSNLEQQ